MKLKEYLLIRWGIKAKKIAALSNLEARAFGVVLKKGWPKRYADLELSEDIIKTTVYAVLLHPNISTSAKYRLRRYFIPETSIAAARNEWSRTRKIIFKRDGGVCKFCGCTDNLQVDHKLPKSLFPTLTFDLDNLQILCAKCNAEKGVKVFSEYFEEFKDKLEDQYSFLYE